MSTEQDSRSDGSGSLTTGLKRVVVASMGIGLGLWWAVFTGLELLRMHRAGAVPFHPGWWGFVFPVAAMTLSITAVGQALGSTPIEAVGAVAAGILMAVWVLVAVRTIRLVAAARTR